jgi:hypothetical protein
MFMEGIENLSRELKYIETVLGRDTDLKGLFHNFIERWTLGDKYAISHIGEWDKNRIIRGINEESHYPSGKKQALQAEGIIMENDYFPPNNRPYIGENQGWLWGNTPVGRLITAFANKWIQKILNNFHMYSLHFKAIKKEMKQRQISDPYQTKAMHRLEDYMRKTADVMTDRYIENKWQSYKVLTKPQLKKVRFEITKKMYNFLQFTANTVALLTNGKEVVLLKNKKL